MKKTIVGVVFLLMVSAVVWAVCSSLMWSANKVVRERVCIAWVDGVYSAVLTMEAMAGASMSDEDKMAILRGAAQVQEFDFTGEEIVAAHNKLYDIYHAKERM